MPVREGPLRPFHRGPAAPPQAHQRADNSRAEPGPGPHGPARTPFGGRKGGGLSARLARTAGLAEGGVGHDSASDEPPGHRRLPRPDHRDRQPHVHQAGAPRRDRDHSWRDQPARSGEGRGLGRSLIPTQRGSILIGINAFGRVPRIMLKTTGESIMPADALLMSTIVVAIFVTFAGALAWADRQTSAGPLKSDVKRRSS